MTFRGGVPLRQWAGRHPEARTEPAMAQLSITALGTVLGVWAHPDDEAYLSAGLMALARDAGQRVVCVTATRGEHGTADPTTWPPGRLGRLREVEARASLSALGVTEHHLLEYVDGTCGAQDAAAAIDRLVDVIADVRPDTIVTFGQDGITGHDDHRTVSAWATAAHRRAAADARLLYATTTAAFADRWQDLHDRFNIYLDPDLPLRTPAEDVALEIQLDGALADRKLVALRAQASQTAGLVAAIGEQRYRAWIATEAFTLAPTSGGALRTAVEHRASGTPITL